MVFYDYFGVFEWVLFVMLDSLSLFFEFDRFSKRDTYVGIRHQPHNECGCEILAEPRWC